MHKTRRESGNGLRGLLLVNAALLGVLAVVTLSPSLFAQNFRPRGEYTMVAGRVQGINSDVVYIVDETSQQMLALGFDPNTKRINGLGGADLAADLLTGGRNRN